MPSRPLLTAALTIVALVATVLPATGQTGNDVEVPEHLTDEFLRELDTAVVSGTITPPGAEITEKQAELNAYDDLVQGYRDMTPEELTETFFKDGAWGELEVDREYSPRADVTIKRDAKWGDPHIYGETDLAAAFGAGYVAAEDRLPILMLLRALGRAEAFELLGNNEAYLMDAELVRLYGYTEEEFQAQIDRMPEEFGQPGQDLVDYLAELVKGINTFILDARAGVVPTPAGAADLAPIGEVPLFQSTDIVAIVAIVRALFGADGGNELGSATTWLNLIDAYGEEQGATVYEDFRNRFNLDGPLHTTDEQFEYMAPPFGLTEVDTTPGNVLGYTSGDPGLQARFEQLGNIFTGLGPGAAAAEMAALHESTRIRWEDMVLETPAGVIDLSRSDQGSMSNYLIAGGSRTESGNPILIGGPQAGYFDPQILMENTIHSPTLNVAGATFPGFGLVIVGRTQDYAWSPTAGGSDMIDTYIEVLCEPDGGDPTEASNHYLFDADGEGGQDPVCTPMDRRLVREAPEELAQVLPDIYAERSVHGPIIGRGSLNDQPVAVSRKRSTYLKELDPGVSILKLNRNEATTGEDFVDIFAESHTLSTNWGYASKDEIAYFHGGLFPIRPDDIHPDFPVLGTGYWEWEKNSDGTDRFRDGETHPHEVNPDRDFFVSWNNRQSPGWSEDDSGWGFSSVYRADMLEDQIIADGEAGRKIDPVRLTQMMEHAGLTDLRGSHVLPLVLRVLEAGSAPDERTRQMADLLRDWIAPPAGEDYAWGALRRDADEDGEYEATSAIAIMDAWWDPLIGTMYDEALGQPVGDVSRQGFHNAPGSAGSAFQGGFYGQVWTDLAQSLGDDVLSPTSRTYCGADDLSGGSLDACADDLWASLQAVGEQLAEDQDSEDPDDWTADAQGERILFLPTAALSMHWVNRPTTQAFATFGEASADPAADPEPEPGSAPAPAPAPASDDPDLAATGGGAGAVLFGLLALGGLAVLRRRDGARVPRREHG